MLAFKKILLFLFIFFLLFHFCGQKTDRFSLTKIQSDLTFHPEWEVPNRSIENILDQPYFYLGHGAQTYVFISKDGNHVLKFYRHHRCKHPLEIFSPILPSSLKNRLLQTIGKRHNKRLKDFSSYVLAHQKLSEETGLVYLHLNRTTNLKKKLVVYDKILVRHLLDLDNYSFIVQKKADPFYPTMETWIEQNEWETAEKALSELIGLLTTRCKKELSDKDPDLRTNFGFIKNVPIQFDIGRFKMDPSRAQTHSYHDELIRIADKLCHWLDIKAPRLSQHIHREIAKKK